MLSSTIDGFRELPRRTRACGRGRSAINRQLKEVERTKSRLYVMTGKLIRADGLPLICTVSSTGYQACEEESSGLHFDVGETGLAEAGTGT